MSRVRVFGILVSLGAVTLANAVIAKSITVMIPMQDVVVSEVARGNSYVLRFDLPTDITGKRLDGVFLDFVVDTYPKSEAEDGAAPVVAVCPLTAAAGATLDYTCDVPSVRPVAMGEGQSVRVDITSIIRSWLANPASNHGLVVGGLVGPDVARVDLKSGTFDGPAFQVTFFYQNRSGERISTR